MGSEMGRPGGLALSGVREQESVYGLQQALNMGVKWRSAGKRTNNSSHSYQKLMERANMLNLGLMLESGRGGLPQDLKAAFQLYQKAAEKGVAEAYCKVALIPNP